MDGGIGAVPDEADDLLMRRAGAGDGTAFARLVERHAGRARAMALRITGNAADADEALQEAFLRAWRKAPGWRANDEHEGTASFATWLGRVVVNLAIDRRRRPAALPLDVAGDPPDGRRSVESHLADRETAMAVAAAIDRLPDRQRAALLLCHFEGLSNADAAAALEIGVGALEALLVRARRGLRAMLEPHRDALMGEIE
jgi:RNA polymerase sigma-70 factor (ECF subfamily)